MTTAERNAENVGSLTHTNANCNDEGSSKRMAERNCVNVGSVINTWEDGESPIKPPYSSDCEQDDEYKSNQVTFQKESKNFIFINTYLLILLPIRPRNIFNVFLNLFCNL